MEANHNSAHIRKKGVYIRVTRLMQLIHTVYITIKRSSYENANMFIHGQFYSIHVITGV